MDMINAKSQLDAFLESEWATPDRSNKAYELYAKGEDESLSIFLGLAVAKVEELDENPTSKGLIWDDEAGWVYPRAGDEWKVC